MGLILGSTRFAVVQAVQAPNFIPDDWRIPMPIGVAHGTLATSAAWRSETLHTFYQRALRSERLAATGGATLRCGTRSAIRCVVNGQSEILMSSPRSATTQTEALGLIRHAMHDTARLLGELTATEQVPPTISCSTGDAALDRGGVVPLQSP